MVGWEVEYIWRYFTFLDVINFRESDQNGYIGYIMCAYTLLV